MRTLGLSLLPILLAACATTRGHFDPTARSRLELGKTTVAQATEIFGEPRDIEKDEETGLQTALWYLETKITVYFLFVMDLTNRDLTLEFGEDGLLNGYEFVSGFEEDVRELDEDPVELIRPGSTRRAEILTALGEPNGLARCPTRFESECESGEYLSYEYESLGVGVTLDDEDTVSSLTVRRPSNPGFEEPLPFPPAPWLEPGESSPDDVIAALGPAGNDRRTVGSRSLSYVRGDIPAGGLGRAILDVHRGRGIRLDLWGFHVFADLQTVHGYLFFSTRDGELPPSPDASRVTLGQSETEVLNALGEPHGRLQCPNEWAPGCESGTAWLWGSVGEVRFGGEKTEDDETKPEPETLKLYFDDQGNLTAVDPPASQPEPAETGSRGP